jgi:hypothetical protein
MKSGLDTSSSSYSNTSKRGWTSPFLRGTWNSSFQRGQSVLYFVWDLKGLFVDSPPVTSNVAKGSEEPAAASRGIASSRRQRRADGVAVG